MEDAAVSEIFDLDRRIDPGDGIELDRGAVLSGGRDPSRLWRDQVSGPIDGERLGTVEPERACVTSDRQLERQDSHLHEVRTVDPFKRSGDHCLDSEQAGAFGRPYSG